MSGIHYAQCWEDPRTLVQALEVTPQDDVISVASGGDNTLALLLNNPRSLIAVDRNPAQIFLVELKIRAIQRLEYDDFVRFVGARPCQDRLKLYSYVRPFLSQEARGYWDGQTQNLVKGIIHSGKFERYFRVFRKLVLPPIHDRKAVEQLLAGSSLDEQRIFYDRVWNNRRWRWLFRIFFGKFLLGHLGRDPSFFQHVTLDKVGEEILTRTRHGLTEVPIQDNYFVEYILTEKYRNLEKAHPYLRESNFSFLREHAEQVRLVCADINEHLKSLEPGSVSRFNLSDIFEYTSYQDFERMLREILRVCRSGARMASWTLLTSRNVPPGLTPRIDPCTSASRELFAQNRTFFYGSFHVWRVATKKPSDEKVKEFDQSQFHR
jgi:S-adenosylmethionine-diacylglycerol 3-amino-3-carboxypropyl transferase